MGAFDPRPSDDVPLARTIVLLGAGATFWRTFQSAPEAADGRPDPIDRWSRRVVSGIATQVGALDTVFPFDGPPYAPFIRWALESGRAFQCPVGMLVHDQVGLMISYRGALLFDTALPYPALSGVSPCDACPERPCTTACPVGALCDTAPYDVAGCHAFLDTPPGADCLESGCAARRACPVSRGAERTAAQSALHMKAFHPT